MKKIVSFLMAVMMLLTLSVSVSAAEVETKTMYTEASEVPQQRLNITLGASLNSESWSTIVTDNNWLNEDIVVSSDSSNDGPVYVKITKVGGADIVAQKLLYPGKSVTLGPVKWNAGTYKVVGRTVYSDDDGGFTFTLKD